MRVDELGVAERLEKKRILLPRTGWPLSSKMRKLWIDHVRSACSMGKKIAERNLGMNGADGLRMRLLPEGRS
jgi:hypothetical protein